MDTAALGGARGGTRRFLMTSLALMGSVGAAAPALAVEQGPYVGAAIGMSYTPIDNAEEARDLNAELAPFGLSAMVQPAKQRDTMFKAFAGYRFNRHLAAEFGYHDLGRVSETFTIVSGGAGSGDLRVETKGFTASVVGLLPAGDRVTAFAKVGAHFWDVSSTLGFTGPGGSVTASASATGVSPIVGIGVLLHFGERLALRAEYERAPNVGDENKTGKGDFDLFTVGLQIHFQ